jgi:hypothetical protein
MVIDHYRDDWSKQKPWVLPQPPLYPQPPSSGDISRAEFEELKRQVAEMIKLIKRAKDYDAKNGEPDCEMDEKMEVVREVAKFAGVDLDAELCK